MTANAVSCPISTCPWSLWEDPELAARNAAAAPAVAAALGTPLDAFESIRRHQLATRLERELEQHLTSHTVLEWVTELMAARAATQVTPSPGDPHVGWVEWIRSGTGTTHVAYAHENGDVYDPEHGWNPDEFVLAKAAGDIYPLIRTTRNV